MAVDATPRRRRRSRSMLLAMLASIAVDVVCCRPVEVTAITESQLWHLLNTTPCIVREKAPQPAKGLRYFRVRDTPAQGFVNPKLSAYGHLKNGQDVEIVPLLSGGSGGVFYVLLFTEWTSRPRFVGYIPSKTGHLQVSVDHGQLKAVTPIYSKVDAQCCPSRHRTQTYALSGIHLKTLGEKIAPESGERVAP